MDRLEPIAHPCSETAHTVGSAHQWRRGRSCACACTRERDLVLKGRQHVFAEARRNIVLHVLP